MPSTNRPFAIATTSAQWMLASHRHTTIGPSGVELAFANPKSNVPADREEPAGLAFDSHCRLYHSLPEENRVEKLLWAAPSTWPSGQPVTELEKLAADPVPFIGDAPDGSTSASHLAGAEFAPKIDGGGSLARPTALGVDCDDRLFVLSEGSGEVLIFDLASERMVGRVSFVTPGGARATPIDLTVFDRDVIVLTKNPTALFWMNARSQPIALTLAAPAPSRGAFHPPGAPPPPAMSAAQPMIVFDPPLGDAERVSALSRKMIAVLERRPGGCVVRFPRFAFGERLPNLDLDGTPSDSFGGGTDIALYEQSSSIAGNRPDVVLVIARAKDDPSTGAVEATFARYLRTQSESPAWTWDRGLRCPDYDGRGIVVTPDPLHPIGYWSRHGFTIPLPDRPKYEQEGRLITQGFDSGAFQTQWGRVFFDACIPVGTNVEVAFATRDETPDPADELLVVRDPPAGIPPGPPQPAVLVLAPMPAQSMFEAPVEVGPIHRRATGRELPWTQIPPEEGFRTFEAPVIAAPGRWLWIYLRLTGSSRATPTIRTLRAEHPSHDLLARLPATFSRESKAAEFLLYFLASLEGTLKEIESRAAAREMLIEAQAAPADLLPWLATFVGLALDGRWSEKAKRDFIAEAAALFRYRGTKASLERMLEIALGVRPILLERWRLRENGGALVGGTGTRLISSVVGVGFRVGTAVGVQQAQPVGTSLEETFRAAAHRFSVIVPRSLSRDEIDMAAFVLDHHRPAHTDYDLCTIDAGIRVGLGLHVGLSTIIGRSDGFATARLGESALGRGVILGQPQPGMLLGTTSLGLGSRPG